MIHRTGRPLLSVTLLSVRRHLLIALVAMLQLVLQPLAATAWCAVALAGSGDSCCCSPVAESPGDSGGCCAPAAPDQDVPDREHGTPCGCYSAPSLPPATHPEAPEELRSAAALLAPTRAALGPPLPYPGHSAPPPRVPIPGVGPPRHLLIQVFRL